jgi:hypothetical protein
MRTACSIGNSGECSSNEVGDNFGSRRHLAADDLPRDDHRDRRDVLLENRRRERCGSVELRRELFHDGKRLVDASLRHLRAFALSVGEAGLVSFGDQT